MCLVGWTPLSVASDKSKVLVPYRPASLWIFLQRVNILHHCPSHPWLLNLTLACICLSLFIFQLVSLFYYWKGSNEVIHVFWTCRFVCLNLVGFAGMTAGICFCSGAKSSISHSISLCPFSCYHILKNGGGKYQVRVCGRVLRNITLCAFDIQPLLSDLYPLSQPSWSDWVISQTRYYF